MREVDLNVAAQRIAEEFHRLGANRAPQEPSSGDGSFGKVLEGYLKETDGLQKEADVSVTQLMKGEKQDVHEVMLDVAKADISFRMMLEVRNKLVEAYQEVMRMSV